MTPVTSLPELAIATPRQEIVFILDDVAGHEQLAASFAAEGREVVVLSAQGDGLAQIAQALEGRSGIDALHVVSHGSADGLALGSLTLGSTEADARQPELAAIGRSLAPDADVLLYGCDAGAQAGLADAIAIATGADVAMSNDRTGHVDLGGDWDLEVTSGSIEAAPVVDAQVAAGWHDVLAIASATITFDNIGNFSSQGNAYNPIDNATYRVNGSAAYQLVIDGAQQGSATYAGYNKVYLGSRNGSTTESSVTLSFAQGQVFTAGSLSFSNWAGYMPGSTTQTFVVTGYDRAGHVVGAPQSITLPESDAGTLNFFGMTDVTSLKITSTTNGGNLLYFAIDNFAVSNVRPADPTITYVSASTPNGTYKVGDTIQIAVAFDQAVVVTGTPMLTLETGTTDRSIAYTGGSGNSILTFSYTVQAGDRSLDLDVLSSTALALNGGTIKTAAGAVADLTLPAPGSVGSLSANTQIVIDGIAPTLVISASSQDLKAGETSTLTFTFSEDPGATFTSADITVTGGTLGALSGSGLVRTAVFTPSAGTNDGAGSVSVPFFSYADAAGNLGSSAGVAIYYDTLVPAAPSTPDLQAGSDTGLSSTDNLTRDRTPAFSGTAEAGATVTLYDTDGTTVLGITTADGSGNWTITSSTLADGLHAVTARAVDAAGNASTASAALALTIDASAPAVVTPPDLAAASDTGTSSTDNVTNAATPTLTGTTEANATVRLYASDGVTVIATTTAGSDGTWSMTPALAEGGHVLTVRAQDAAGNLSGNSAPLSLVIDRTAPTTTVVSVALSADTGASATDFVTRTASQTLSGLLSAPLAAGESVQVSLDNGASWSAATAATGSANWSLSATLASSDTLLVKVVDTAGNAGPVLSQAYTLDTSLPSVAISSDRATLAAGQTATITFTFSEVPVGLSHADIAVSGGTLGPLSGSGNVYTATFTPTPDTNGGTASITVDAGSYTDLAGNGGNAGVTPVLQFDTLAPAAPSVPDLLAGSDSGGSATDNRTNDATPTLAGTAEANATITVYDGAIALGTTSADAGGNWSFTAPVLADGSHVITTTATDAAGNTGAASGALAITIDTAAPAAPASPTLAAGSDTGASATDGVTADATPTFTGTAEAGATVRLYATDGITVLGSTTAGVDGSWSITAAALADGTHLVTVRAEDTAGNISAPSAASSVLVDTSAPAASSTPDLHASSDTGASDNDDVTADATPTFTGTAENGARVQLFDADDNLLGESIATGGTWSITASTLAEGAHVVSTRVTDLAGNTSAASAGLAVVVDLTGPTGVVTSATFSRDTGRSGTDFVTRIADQVISGTLDAPLAAGESVQVSLDDGLTWSTASVAPDGSWSHAATLTGSGTLHVRVVDILDRAGVAWTQAYELDTTAPDPLASPTLVVDSDRGASGTDRLTNDNTPTVSGTAEAGARVRLYDSDGTMVGAQTADADGHWTITSDALADGTHQLTVTSTDFAGNLGAASAPLEITIDRDRPTVTHVVSPNAAGTYKAGDVIAINVRFSEAVVVDGQPQLMLANGAGGAPATYVGGSGGKVLTFHYTVQPGDTSADLDYVGIGALRLNGGSITDIAGNNAVRTLPEPGAGSLADVEDLAVDGIAPTLGAARIDGNVLTLRFREGLDGDHLPRLADFTVRADGTVLGVRDVTYDAASNSLVLQLRGSALPGQDVSIAYLDAAGDQARAIQDLAGNDAASFDVAVRNVQLVGVAADLPPAF